MATNWLDERWKKNYPIDELKYLQKYKETFVFCWIDICLCLFLRFWMSFEKKRGGILCEIAFKQGKSKATFVNFIQKYAKKSINAVVMFRARSTNTHTHVHINKLTGGDLIPNSESSFAILHCIMKTTFSLEFYSQFLCAYYNMFGRSFISRAPCCAELFKSKARRWSFMYVNCHAEFSLSCPINRREVILTYKKITPLLPMELLICLLINSSLFWAYTVDFSIESWLLIVHTIHNSQFTLCISYYCFR